MKRTKPNAQDIGHQQPTLVAALLKWFYRNARDLPWRHTCDPYAIWMSEVMLQQTQVKTVIPYWNRWMRELPTIDALARARPSRLLKLWEGLGYYSRVRHLQKAARIIVAKHRGHFPTEFDEVLALPGVGRYTAGAVCSIAFNQPAPVLDGNVIRVLTRVFGIRQNPKEKTTNARLWRIAETLVSYAARVRPSVPRRFLTQSQGKGNRRTAARNSDISSPNRKFLRSIGTCSALNQALMEFGAVICTPRRPQCHRCPLRPSCVAYRDGLVAELPNRDRPLPALSRCRAAFVFTHAGKVLIRQRPNGVVNAQLWEFPNVEMAPHDGDAPGFAATIVGRVRLRRLFEIKHSITRHRITVKVFHADLSDLQRKRIKQGRWRRLGDLSRLAFPSAHRKILERLKLKRDESARVCPGENTPSGRSSG
jgi:A/G-specific adenine glycosylase